MPSEQSVQKWVPRTGENKTWDPMPTLALPPGSLGSTDTSPFEPQNFCTVCMCVQVPVCVHVLAVNLRHIPQALSPPFCEMGSLACLEQVAKLTCYQAQRMYPSQPPSAGLICTRHHTQLC